MPLPTNRECAERGREAAKAAAIAREGRAHESSTDIQDLITDLMHALDAEFDGNLEHVEVRLGMARSNWEGERGKGDDIEQGGRAGT